MENSNQKQLMILGDEACSHAAIDAGVKGVFCYPGTPSTEVFEGAERIIKKLNDGRVAKIGANEKVAYEFALGASYAGFRTMVTMKHVGLNVAMDAFVNSGITGVNGGMVVLVADDPSMHSSQNEQDTRYLADFACVPCLEPSTPQEVYDYTLKAFDLSESLKLPVVLRLVTRLAHARGPVNTVERKAPVELGVPQGDDKKNWVLIPANARVQYQKLRDKFSEIQAAADEYNKLTITNNKIGVVTSGMGNAYFNQIAREELGITEYSRFDISAYPANKEQLKKITESCEELYVFEENYPYLEDQLIALTRKAKIHGRRDNTLTIAGELNLLKLRKAMALPVNEGKGEVDMELTKRLPKLCDGCGHIDAFNAIKQAFHNIGVEDYRVFGDIGCYTLGTLPPFNSIHACVEMGASLGMTLGAAYTGMPNSIGVIGDSTFFHSGIPSLVSLAKDRVNGNMVIMDNRITAMTGQQETVNHDIFVDLAKAVGLKDDEIHVLNPLPKHHEENVKVLEKAFKHDGPDLIIFQRDCIQAMRKGLYKSLGIKK